MISINSTTYDAEKALVVADWETLEEFKQFYTSIWNVTLESTEAEWLNAFCTCPKYQKEFLCKHTVGIANRMSEFSISENAKTIAINAKRKRGRPAKAKKAYTYYSINHITPLPQTKQKNNILMEIYIEMMDIFCFQV